VREVAQVRVKSLCEYLDFENVETARILSGCRGLRTVRSYNYLEIALHRVRTKSIIYSYIKIREQLLYVKIKQ
jgi:hypothetical protein